MRKKNKKTDRGQVIIPTGQTKPPEPHEVEAAWILARHYSCTIVFLIPVDDYKRKTPDIVMQGLEWEMKSPSGKSKNTIGNQFIRAAKQSKYFIFDGRRTPISDADLEKSIRFEMTKRSSIKRVVFIQSWARWLKSNLKCDIFMISRETGQPGWAVKGVPCFFILGEFRKRNCFMLF